MAYLLTGMITTAYLNHIFSCLVIFCMFFSVSLRYNVFRTTLIWSNIPCCNCTIIWYIWTSTTALKESFFMVLFHSWICSYLHQLIVVCSLLSTFKLFMLIRPVRSGIKYIVRIFSRLYFFTNLTCVVIVEVIKILLRLKRVLIYDQNFITYWSSRYILFVLTFTLSFNFNVLTIRL
jgi:hypothetical protein